MKFNMASDIQMTMLSCITFAIDVSTVHQCMMLNLTPNMTAIMSPEIAGHEVGHNVSIPGITIASDMPLFMTFNMKQHMI